MAMEVRSASAPAREHLDGLVGASLAGDAGAREQLARWCLPRVRRTVLLTCGSGPDVEDLVQISMARIIAKLHSFRGEASFFVWADRITVNVVRGHFRRQSWLKQRIFEYWTTQQLLEEAPERPDRSCARSRLFDLLALELGKLKPDQRLPVVLHMLHGYTVPEIAAMLEISFEAAKKRLQRGRRALIARLQRHPACRELLQEVLS